jgi:hypothetical protein
LVDLIFEINNYLDLNEAILSAAIRHSGEGSWASS